MKSCTAAGSLVCVPLILSSVASADFVGFETVKKPVDPDVEQLVSLTVNLYAVFSDDDGDGIGDGSVLAVGGIPGQEGVVTVRDGFFYQHPDGGRTAPLDVGHPPEVLADTFVTIGWKLVPRGTTDATDLSQGFPLEDGIPTSGGVWTTTTLRLADAAWFSFPPEAPQTMPGQADNPSNQVVLGQFSVAAVGAGPNAGVSGTLRVAGLQGDGTTFVEYLSFDNQVLCPWDLDGSGSIGTADLLDLLSQWGTDPGGPPDFDGDGNVGTSDLLALLSNWGGCPLGACCFDDQSCSMETLEDCQAVGGAYQGDLTSCDDPCPPPTGACCLCDGSCTQVTEDVCAVQGGVYQGDFSDCDAVTCVPFGACCGAFGCSITPEAPCVNQGKIWLECGTCNECP